MPSGDDSKDRLQMQHWYVLAYQLLIALHIHIHIRIHIHLCAKIFECTNHISRTLGWNSRNPCFPMVSQCDGIQLHTHRWGILVYFDSQNSI